MPETETELFDYERRVYSYSDELTTLGNNRTVSVSADFSTDSPLVSPVIDTVRAKIISVGNIVTAPSSNMYDEFFNYGTTKTKYISPPITLASGQDAEDLQVVLSAYRPVSSDILVYAKFLNAQDSSSLASKTWTLLMDNSISLYSDYRNVRDYREFTYSLATSLPNTIFQTATVSVNTTSTTVTGTGTSFTSTLAVNRYIQVGTDIRQITAITNNTVLTVNTAFSVANSAAALTIIAPPTTAYLAQDGNTAISGFVTVSNASNLVTGSGTAFDTELKAGDVLTVAGADSRVVVTVGNSTTLTVDLPYQATVSAANAAIVTSAGMTYQDSNGQKYVTFKTFQLKIVLLSSDTARVPRIDDVRVLALQL
jgi:hypothetical protein